MSLIRGLIDRLLLVCAIVAGGLVPGFISQYRQRLGGRLDQARLDLAPWQKIADQYYHGDLGQLIQYHLASRDATFHAEGGAIQALVTSVQHLQSEAAALHGSLFEQAAYLSLHADPDLLRATLGDWVPTFGLSGEAIVFALIFAVCVWLIFQTSWSVTAAGGRHLSARLRRPPPQARPQPQPSERSAGRR